VRADRVLGLAIIAGARRSARHGWQTRQAGHADRARPARQQHQGLIARDLFSDHVFAFELTSVLLVIAVVGTVLLARAAPRSCPARCRRRVRR
jgi:NADH:ubiquinone oxidoreductase subunit 6 (subunit J)